MIHKLIIHTMLTDCYHFKKLLYLKVGCGSYLTKIREKIFGCISMISYVCYHY